MNKKIFLFGIVIFLVCLVSAVSSDKTYMLTIKPVNGTISFYDLKLFNSQFIEFSNKNEGDYIAKIVEGEKVLYQVNFSVVETISVTPNSECLNSSENVVCDIGPKVMDKNYIILNLPYYDNANAIRVYNKDAFIFEHKLKESSLDFMGFVTNHLFVVCLVLFVLFVLIIIIIYSRKGEVKPVGNPYQS